MPALCSDGCSWGIDLRYLRLSGAPTVNLSSMATAATAWRVCCCRRSRGPPPKDMEHNLGEQVARPRRTEATLGSHGYSSSLSSTCSGAERWAGRGRACNLAWSSPVRNSVLGAATVTCHHLDTAGGIAGGHRGRDCPLTCRRRFPSVGYGAKPSRSMRTMRSKQFS